MTVARPLAGDRIQELPLAKQANHVGVPSLLYLAPGGQVIPGEGAYNAHIRDQGMNRAGDLVENLKIQLMKPGWSAGGRTAQDLMTELARHLRDLATEALPGAETTSCGFTHPCRYGADHRAALAASLEEAGWANPSLLPEPIAALLGWLDLDETRDGLQLVLDVGHGTTDVALIDLVRTGGTVRVAVLAEAGLDAVSGRIFHNLLRDALWGKPEFRMCGGTEDQIQTRFKRIQRDLEEQIREAREALSDQEVAEIFVDSYPNESRLLEYSISRAEYAEILSRRQVNTVLMELIDDLLDDVDIERTDVNSVLVTGRPGYTQVVIEEASLAFNGRVRRLDRASDAKKIVSHGAAKYANRPDSLIIRGIVPRSILVGPTGPNLLKMGSAAPCSNEVAITVRGASRDLTLFEHGIGEPRRPCWRITLPPEVQSACSSADFELMVRGELDKNGLFKFGARMNQRA